MCFSIKITADALSLANRYQVPLAPNVSLRGKTRVQGFEHPQVPVVLPHAIEMRRWGLIPAWVRGREHALEFQNKTLNARVESVFEKASFAEAIRHRRCLVPVQAFYEWKHQGKLRIPYEILPAQDEFLSLAGIWETWISPQTQTAVAGFSILTCAANPLMAQIHNSKLRMPLVIGPQDQDLWLDAKTAPTDLLPLMQAYPDHWLHARCLDAEQSALELI